MPTMPDDIGRDDEAEDAVRTSTVRNKKEAGPSVESQAEDNEDLICEEASDANTAATKGAPE